jgi:hypothetical protein
VTAEPEGTPMIEVVWLEGTRPTPMLEFLRGKASDRKYWLYCSACLRRVWPFAGEFGEHFRQAVELLESYADGMAAADESQLLYLRYPHAADAAVAASTDAADCAAAHHDRERGLDFYIAWDAERPKQAELLRDIIGNPFRPSPSLPAAVLAWNDGTVRRIAEAIYEERAFGRMPILHDALLDAGCDNEELLAHLRSEGPHVLGCWALDLLLGKE